jgi:neutral trehalase
MKGTSVREYYWRYPFSWLRFMILSLMGKRRRGEDQVHDFDNL